MFENTEDAKWYMLDVDNVDDLEYYYDKIKLLNLECEVYILDYDDIVIMVKIVGDIKKTNFLGWQPESELMENIRLSFYKKEPKELIEELHAKNRSDKYNL